MVKQERVCGVGGRSLAECLICQTEREENKPPPRLPRCSNFSSGCPVSAADVRCVCQSLLGRQEIFYFTFLTILKENKTRPQNQFLKLYSLNL